MAEIDWYWATICILLQSAIIYGSFLVGKAFGYNECIIDYNEWLEEQQSDE